MSKSYIKHLVSALLILCAVSTYAQQKVTVWGDKSYPPYSYEENGQPKGIYVDILTAAFAQMPDFDVTIKMIPWKRGMAMVEEGKSFAIFPPYYSEKRVPWMLFSEPILEEQVIIFGKAETLAGKEVWPDDFMWSTIGMNRGFGIDSMGGKAFAEAVEAGNFEIDEANTTEQNLMKLDKGRVDLYINDRMVDISAYPDIKRGPVANINWGYLGFTKKDQHFSFLPAFKEQFDQVIKSMKENNQIQPFIDKYTK